MLLSEGTVNLYVPSQRTMYTGLADQAIAKNAWSDVMSAMLFDVSESALPKDAALSFVQDMVILQLKDGELRFDKATGLIRQWRQADSIITYDRYTEHTPELPPLPEHIEVLAVDGSQHAIFMLSQPVFNSVSESIYDLSEYKPETVRDFGELEK